MINCDCSSRIAWVRCYFLYSKLASTLQSIWIRTLHSLHNPFMQIQFEIPPEAAHSAGLDSVSPSRTAQGMLALFLYEHGKLSLGKACEWGQMSQWEFMDQARVMGVLIDAKHDDLNGDMDALRRLTH